MHDIQNNVLHDDTPILSNSLFTATLSNALRINQIRKRKIYNKSVIVSPAHYLLSFHYRLMVQPYSFLN